MDVTYNIVKVYVTECNDVIKKNPQYCYHNRADVSNRSECIMKNLSPEMKSVQEKESIMGVRGG